MSRELRRWRSPRPSFDSAQDRSGARDDNPRFVIARRAPVRLLAEAIPNLATEAQPGNAALEIAPPLRGSR